MSNFNMIQTAVNAQLQKMIKSSEALFYVDVDKDALYDLYLSSFPEGTNPIYKERTEHDCTCCKQFIRAAGNIVTFDKKGNLITIWDVNTGEDTYQPVADALSSFIKQQTVKNVFLTDVSKVGNKTTNQLLDGSVLQWNHFYFDFPKEFVVKDGSIDSKKGSFFTNKDVLERSIRDIADDAIEMVLGLIAQKSIYRGEEHKATVEMIKKVRNEYKKSARSPKEVQRFFWLKSIELGSASKFKNTVIGTLLWDLSSGVELEDAVKMFESKVAPHNYKRSSALITQKMITDAQQKIDSLGLQDALPRRFARVDDVTINNVLFADRQAKKLMTGGLVEDLLEGQTKKNKKNQNFDKVQEITIDTFISDVLPTMRSAGESIEVMVENSHISNMVSLIAPVNEVVKPLFKWDNNFSWSYNGEVTDSIKERVKAAGGQVDADVRVSLSWFNYDDLDLGVIEPSGNKIYFSNKRSYNTDGQLDIDMNAGGGSSRNAVENVFWKNRSKMEEGVYTVYVHNYAKRESIDVGFDVEIDYLGQTYNFNYENAVRDSEKVIVAKFKYSKKDGLSLVESIPCKQRSQEVWGIKTNEFTRVKMVMTSPNHWDAQEIGNKHWFFMLENCASPNSARGFYNEFLRNELNEHRKVFEVLSSKLKAEPTQDQLSGLGFSSTQQNHLICKVSGSFNRILKIKF